MIYTKKYLIKNIKYSVKKLTPIIKLLIKTKNINFNVLNKYNNNNKGIKIITNIINNIINSSNTNTKIKFNRISINVLIYKGKTSKKIWTKAKGKNTIIRKRTSNIIIILNKHYG